jgi:E3 ubiquitin-protein ligase HUWE1
LLPAVLIFFLVHTSDIVILSQTANNSDGDNQSKASADPHAVASSSTALGNRHRQSTEYRNMNISLFNDNFGNSNKDDVSPISLQQSRSLRSMGSTFSVLLSHRAQRLHNFVHAHRTIINLLIQSQPSLISEGPLKSLIQVVQLRPYISFENKRKYFLQQLQSHRLIASGIRTSSSIRLHVHRESVFEDSYDQLRSRSAAELQGRLNINFEGEQGIDAGGLTREWYSVVAREIFNPGYALFTAAADGATFQPNPFSMINSNHLSYFNFVGRVIGKALVDGQLIDAHFTR